MLKGCEAFLVCDCTGGLNVAQTSKRFPPWVMIRVALSNSCLIPSTVRPFVELARFRLIQKGSSTQRYL